MTEDGIAEVGAGALARGGEDKRVMASDINVLRVGDVFAQDLGGG
jgi:hypothetical protein